MGCAFLTRDQHGGEPRPASAQQQAHRHLRHRQGALCFTYSRPGCAFPRSRRRRFCWVPPPPGRLEPPPFSALAPKYQRRPLNPPPCPSSPPSHPHHHHHHYHHPNSNTTIEQRILQSNATQYFGVAKTKLHGKGHEAHAAAKAQAMRDISRFYGVPDKCAFASLFDCSNALCRLFDCVLFDPRCVWRSASSPLRPWAKERR